MIKLSSLFIFENRTWSIDETKSGYKLKNQGSFSEHTDRVTALTVHPLGHLICTAGMDGMWTFADIETGSTISKTHLEEVSGKLFYFNFLVGYNCAMVHPDGMLLGTGGTVIRLFDLKTSKEAAKLVSIATSIHFSENGYHLATTGPEGLSIFDLRKIALLKNYEIECDKVQFDFSGKYVMVSGEKLTIFGVKKLEVLHEIEGDYKCFSWCDNDSKAFVTGGSKRSVALWGC
jgi:WD40 repeat protein